MNENARSGTPLRGTADRATAARAEASATGEVTGSTPGRSAVTVPDLEEREEAIEIVGELLREYFVRDGATIRIVVDPIPDAEWRDLDLAVVNRYPDGLVKVERLCEGLSVELVRERPEARPARTIPVEPYVQPWNRSDWPERSGL